MIKQTFPVGGGCDLEGQREARKRQEAGGTHISDSVDTGDSSSDGSECGETHGGLQWCFYEERRLTVVVVDGQERLLFRILQPASTQMKNTPKITTCISGSRGAKSRATSRPPRFCLCLYFFYFRGGEVYVKSCHGDVLFS